MKKIINSILAALILAAAMSIYTSCTKENLEPETAPTENKLPVETFNTTLPSKVDTLIYEGREFTIPFKVLKNGTYTLKVKSQEAEGAQVSVSLSSAKTCTIKVTPNKTKGSASVTITNGKTNATCKIDFDSYHLAVTGLPESFGDGQQYDFNLNVDTNLPDKKVIIQSDSWIKTTKKGNTLSVSVLANQGTSERKGTLSVLDAEGILQGFAAEIRQDYILVNKPGMVQFTDRAFKAAVLPQADANKDGDISPAEAQAVKELIVSDKGIKDLTGLDAFKNLEKFDAMNNDIENADIIASLRYLHWLDLTGNKNLKSFDVTGCTMYFEHCEFECSDELQYRMLNKMINIGSHIEDIPGSTWSHFGSDPHNEHAVFVKDERRTSDWSRQHELVKVYSHTKGNGKYKVCFTGMGYIDEDIKDGTFQRIMLEGIQVLFDCHPEMRRVKDYFDVYYLYHMEEIHEQWHYTTEKEQIQMMELRNPVFVDLSKTVFGKVTTGNMDDHATVGQQYSVLCIMMDLHNCVNIPCYEMCGTITQRAGCYGYENDKLWIDSHFLSGWNVSNNSTYTPSYSLSKSTYIEQFIQFTGL